MLAKLNRLVLCALWMAAIVESTSEVEDKALTSVLESTTPTVQTFHTWMDSVMFNHTLHWKIDNGEWNYTVYLYTVFQKHHYGSKWKSISSCSNITMKQCDLTNKLHKFITYDIQVKIEDKGQQSMSNMITFCAEYDTKLLPPMYNVSRMNDVIFVQPNTRVFEERSEDLKSYSYEVKYWPKNGQANISSIQFESVDTIFGIKNLEPSWVYCVTARFFEPTLVGSNTTSEKSDWGQEVCVNGTSIHDENAASPSDILKWVVASVVLALLVIACIGFKLRKTYKKIQKHDETLPEYLNVVKEEIKHSDCDVTESAISVCEKIDRIDNENSYIKLDPAIHQLLVNEDWLVPLQDDAGLDVMQRQAYDGGSDDSTNTVPVSSGTNQSSRSRSRSRGYHSFSSDDVTGDDVTTLAHDTYVDIEYANTNQVLKSVFGNKPTRKMSSGSESDYLHMTGLGHGRQNMQPIALLTRSSSEDAKQSKAGQAPYENFTYCSQLYGNVPDAFVCPTAQLRMSTEL